MRWLFWRREVPLCEFQDSCNCEDEKEVTCKNCGYYIPLDSENGCCKALPNPVLVAWCKDICSFFKII